MKSTSPTSIAGFLIVPSVLSLKDGITVPIRTGDDYMAAIGDVLLQYRVINADIADYVKKNPDVAVQSLIDHYKLTYIVKIGEEISVYSYALKQKLPDAALRRLTVFLGITPRTPVGWYETTDGNPVFSTASQVLYGQKPKAALQRTSHKRKPTLDWTGPVDWEASSQAVNKLIGDE